MFKKKSDVSSAGNALLVTKRTRMLALEPRMMFDGALAADVAHVDAPQKPVETPPAIAEKSANERLAEPAPGAPKTVIFVDFRVADAPDLLAGIAQNATVVTIGPDENGVQKIADTLARMQNVASVQILSHGGPGFIDLGTAKLDQPALAGAYTNLIAGWREAMTANADVLLLGCDVAQGAEGAAFIAALANATGADVAASTGLTGAAARGGDWTLESATGPIDTRLALADSAMAAYAQLLAAPTISDSAISRSTAEDNALAIAGITVADADPGNAQTITISATHGTITLATTANTSALSGNGTPTVSFVASAANATTAMAGMSFRPDQDFSGTATFTITTDDGTTVASLGSKNITVVANANAPVLTLPATAQVVPEDAASYLDFTGINAIVLTDADANDVQTLTLSVAHGTLLVKTDVVGGITTAGGNGTATVVLTGTAAQLSATLANAQGTQYTSTLNYNSASGAGAEALSFNLADGGAGHTRTGTVALNVTPVNDAPTFTGAVAATVQEGGNVVFSRAQLASSDNALDTDIQTGQQVVNQLMVKIDSLPGGGTLTYRGGAVVVGSVVPVTDLGSLKFTHDGTDIVSNQTFSFNVTVSDGGGGATAGSISVTVQPRNIAPVISGAPTLIEGQVKVVAPVINLGDGFDTLANSTIVIDNLVTGSQGTFFIDANNNNSVDAGEALSGSTVLSPVQRANLATQLKFMQNGYEPNTPGAISPSYRITVTDAGGGTGTASSAVQQTITLTVQPNNDDPTLTNTHATTGTALTTQEGNVITITPAMLHIADADLNPANTAQTTPENQLVYTIGTRPTQGEIQLFIGGAAGYGADGWITLGDGGRFTQAQVTAGLVRYYETVNVADLPVTTTDNFNFTVRDSNYGYDVWTDPANPASNREGGVRATLTGAITAQQFFIDITPLTTPVTTRTDIGAGTYEGGPRPATPGYGGTNVQYSFVATAGMLSNNSIAAGAWDEANVASSGAGYVITAGMLSYTITRTDPGADTIFGTGDDIAVTVPPDETVYTLSAQPGNGTIQSFASGSWQTIPTNGQFTQADINAGFVRFVHDGSENHTSTFGYTVSDGTPNNHSGAFGLDITPTNDRPTVGGGAVQVLEKLLPANDGLVRLGSGALGMADIDLSLDPAKQATPEGRQDFLWFTIVAQPKDTGATQRGELQRWNGTAWVTVTPGEWLPSTLLTMNADGAVSGLRYAHDGSEPLTYPGTPNVNFQYQVRDDLANPGDPLATNSTAVANSSGSVQSNLSANGTATIQVIPINNPPVIADRPGDADPVIGGTIAGGGATTGVNEVLMNVPEGGSAIITSAYLVGIDPDNTTVQRQYLLKSVPVQGVLILNGKLLGVGSTFTQDDIDNNRLTYRHNGAETAAPTIDALGTYNDKFHFVLSDAVSDDVGAGGPNFNTFLITLTPTNDAPTVTGPSGTIEIDSATAANNLVSGFVVADPDLANGAQSGETDFVQATVRLMSSAGVPVTDYVSGFAGGGVSIGYANQAGGLWAVTQSGVNNLLQLQGTRAQVNAALAGLSVTFANDANSMYKVQVIVDDRMRDISGALDSASNDANGGELNQAITAGAAPTAVPATVYDWATAVPVPANDANIAAATVDIRASRVNETPTFTGPAAQTVIEDVRTQITSTFVIADPESAAFNTPVTVTLSIPAGQGILDVAGAGTTQSTFTPAGGQAVTIANDRTNSITLTGRAGDIQALLNQRNFADSAADANGGLFYSAPANANHDFNAVAAGDVTLTLSFNDSGSRFGSDVGAGSVAANPPDILIPITITPVNDAPTVAAGSTPISISGSTAVPGFVVSDVDNTDGGLLNATTGETDFMQVTIRLLPVAGTTPLPASGDVGGIDHTNVVFSSTTPGSATVDATYNGNGAALVIRGTLAEVNGYLSGLRVSLSNGLLNNNTTYRVQVVADDRVRDAAGVLDGSNAANGGLNSDGGSGTANVPVTAVDPYAVAPALPLNVSSNTRTILGSNVNDAPSFAALDATPTFAENGSAIVLDSNASLSDPELSAYSNWDNAVLTLARNSGANADDVFGVTGSGAVGINFNGANIRNGGTVVGTFVNSAGTLAITFNSSADNSTVNSVLRAITYSNSNDNPPASVTVGYTINDGDTDADRAGNGQGTGGALTGSGTIVVGITPTNDTPTLTGITAKSYTEDASPIVIGSGATPGDPELSVLAAGIGQWGNAFLVVSRSGGAQPEDVFGASGTSAGAGGGVFLDAGNVLRLDGTNIGTYANGAGMLTLTFADGVTTAQAQSALRGITYANTRQSLAVADTAGVTLNWVLHDGDTDADRVGNGQGTGGDKSVTVAQTITLTGVNDAPVLADTVLAISQVEDAAAPSGAVGTLISALASAGNITDADTSTAAVKGLAITAADSTHGTWYYSINGGASWSSFTAGAATARLLVADANTRIYFQPTGDFHGGVAGALTVYAWDSTSGSNGGTADLSNPGTSTGGSTAFSAASDTVALTVTPVNDAPTHGGTTTLAATSEDTTSGAVTAATLAGTLTYSDATDNQTGAGGGTTATAQTALAIVGNAATALQGVWQYTTDGSTWISVATAINNASAVVLDLANANHQIRFVPGADFTGAPGALTLRAADGTWNSATGVQNISAAVGSTGAWSASTATLGITVNPVNDAPTVNGLNATPTFVEGIDTAGNRTVIGTPVVLDPSVNIGDIEIVTQAVDNFGGTTLTIARDNGSGGFAPNVNDILGLSTAGVVSVAGSVVSSGGIAMADITTNSGGQLVITFRAVATSAQVNSVVSAITYALDSDTPPASVPLRYRFNDDNQLSAQGSGGSLTGDATITVTIAAQNDIPLAVDDTHVISEDGANPVSGNVISGTGSPNTAADSDPEGNALTVTAVRPATEIAGGATTAVAGGTTSANGTSIAGTYGTIKLGADGSYTYTLDNANAAVNALLTGQTLNDFFTYTLSDGNGGVDTAQITITINGNTDGALAIVAHDGNGSATGQTEVYEKGLVAPSDNSHVNTDTIAVTAADGIASISVGGTTFTIAPLAGFSVGTPSAGINTGAGTLRITGFAVTGGPAAAPTAGTLSYSYTLNAHQAHAGPTAVESTDTIALVVTDATIAAGTANGTLTVRIVDDTPTATPDTNSVTEDAGVTQATGNVFGGIGAAVTDVADRIGADTTATPVTAVSFGGVARTVGAAFNSTFGSLTLNSDGSYVYTLNNSSATTNALRNGQTVTETFNYTITDADGDTSTTTLTVTVTGANDPPAGADKTVTTVQDIPVRFTPADFGYTDPDVGDTLTNVRIDTLPTVGRLLLNGVPIAAGQIIPVG
ncbi:MAG: hypothetical protein JWN94_3531, partial [Betaproteobacteria bacterium]|nr:hypothetical protein [Betaproteobacteria bacterium]